MPVTATLVDLLHDAQWDPTSDRLLDYFLKYTTARNLSLYPAQEEAVLELLDGKNVILNTPTGSGQVTRGVGDDLRGARARQARCLYLSDQGAGEREVDGALPRVRAGPGRTVDR
jgi:hypothetical protein